MPSLSRPEAPSTDESPPPRSALMPGTKASRPPLIPWFRHLGSASDTRSRAGTRARPKSPTGYSPEPSGHVPLVDFCNRIDPQAQPRPRQTPPHIAMASHRAVGSAAPGEAPPAGLSRFRGHHCALTPCNPHVDLLSQRGFTPSRLTQTPSVAHQCRLRPGKRSQTTTGRIPVPPTTSFETLGGSARRARLDPKIAARLEGPPRAVARESNCLWPHPRCLPPQGPRFRPIAVFPPLPT